MTHPGYPPGPPNQPPAPIRTPVIDKPIAIALALVTVLAIVTVIVVIAKNTGDADEPDGPGTATGAGSGSMSLEPDTDPPPNGGSSTASSDSSADPNSVQPSTVHSSAGVTFDYPKDGPHFDPLKWVGPADISLGAVPALSVVGYEACEPAAGIDMLAGVLTSTDPDLGSAANVALSSLADNLLDEPVTVEDVALDDASTAAGLTGELATGTIVSAEDSCGNTEIRIGTFAVKNADDETVVVFVGYRRDGDLEVDADTLQDTAVDILFSVRLSPA